MVQHVFETHAVFIFGIEVFTFRHFDYGTIFIIVRITLRWRMAFV